MTTLREAAQQALEALEGWDNYGKWVWPESALEQAKRNTTESLAALRAALAEPVQEPDDKAASIRWQLCLLAQTEEFSDDVRNQIGRGVWLIDRLCAALAEPVQEPVAWMVYTLDGKSVCVTDNPADFTDEHRVLPLYTAPPQRKPLAEWQINDLMADIDPEDRDSWSFRQGVYAAEKHHGVRK